MRIVVLTEDEETEIALLIHEGEGIDLIIPNDIIRLAERRILARGDELFEESHKGGDGSVGRGMSHAIVAARHDADQLAERRAVLGHSHRAVSRFLLEREDVGEGGRGHQVGIADDKALLV